MPPRVAVHSLQTERLRLRDWLEEDLDAFRSLNLDRDVRRFFPSVLAPFESDASAAFIRRFLAERGWGLWAVQTLESPTFLGFVGLSIPTFDAPFMPAVEIGWRLTKQVWGRGYATEAATAAVVFGFRFLGLAEIVSFTVPTNQPSLRVMHKLGFTHDPAGDFFHPNIPEGHPFRLHRLYRLSYAQWVRSQREGASTVSSSG
jgi:RimJ/RimL family protein N-acetyltransferase